MKKYIIVTIFICMYSCCLKANNCKVINIQKDTFDLLDMSKNSYLFVITYGYGYTCFDCFKYLVKSLDSLKILNIKVKIIYTYINSFKPRNAENLGIVVRVSTTKNGELK